MYLVYSVYQWVCVCVCVRVCALKQDSLSNKGIINTIHCGAAISQISWVLGGTATASESLLIRPPCYLPASGCFCPQTKVDPSVASCECGFMVKMSPDAKHRPWSIHNVHGALMSRATNLINRAEKNTWPSLDNVIINGLKWSAPTDRTPCARRRGCGAIIIRAYDAYELLNVAPVPVLMFNQKQ